MKNITLGRYVPNNTFIHKIDPRTKLFLLVALLVSIFFPIGIFQYAVLLFITIFLLILSKTSLLSIFKSLKSLWFMMLILIIINAFFVKTGKPLFNIGTFVFYEDALLNTLAVLVRLFLMISLTTILTATTKPLELTSAIEFFFSPLKIIKFPAHEIAMTISIALRFIPTLLDETQKIMKAQASRGVDLEHGKLREKISGVIALIIPLFISSFQRSEELANAMEARGYNPSAKRTKYRQLHFSYKDLISLLFVGLFVFFVIWTCYIL